jgi:hypothetical protein
MSDHLASQGDSHSLRGALQWLAPVYVVICLLQLLAALHLQRRQPKELL